MFIAFLAGITLVFGNYLYTVCVALVDLTIAFLCLHGTAVVFATILNYMIDPSG